MCDNSFFQVASKDSHDLEVTSAFPWASIYDVTPPPPHLHPSFSLSLTMVTHYVLPIFSRSSQSSWEWWCCVKKYMVCQVMSQYCGNMPLFLMKWETQKNISLCAERDALSLFSPDVRLVLQMQSHQTSTYTQFQSSGEYFLCPCVYLFCVCAFWLGNILRVNGWLSRAMS